MSKRFAVLATGLLLLCVGCDTSGSGGTSKANARLLPFPELVRSAAEETEEFRFCMSEDAGFESLQESAKRLSDIVEGLPDAAAAGDLPQAKKDQATKVAEQLKADCEKLASAVESSATSEMAKLSSTILKKIKSISKLSN